MATIEQGPAHLAALVSTGIYRIVEVDGVNGREPRCIAMSFRNCHGYPQAILVNVNQAQGLPRVGERRYSEDLRERYADTRQACEWLIQQHIVNHPIS